MAFLFGKMKRKFFIIFIVFSYFFISAFLNAEMYILKKGNVTAYYNDKRELVKIEEDNNGDRKSDIIKFLKNGKIYKIKQDKNFDNYFETTIFISNGKMEKIETDRNKDGNPDFVSVYKNGSLILEKIDADFNKQFDKFIHFDKNGKIFKQVEKNKVIYFTKNNTMKVVQGNREFFYINNKIIKAVIYKKHKVYRIIFFNDKQIKEKEKIDANLDGAFDRVITYKNGKIVKEKIDSDFNKFFELNLYYNLKGKIKKKEFFKKGCKFPVKTEQGKKLFIDNNCNNIHEKIIIFNKTVKKILIDKDEDRVKEKELNYRKHNLFLYKEDKNKDGKFDFFAYYESGNIYKIEIDSNFDGKIDKWEYYKDNKLIKKNTDLNFDGKIDIEE